MRVMGIEQIRLLATSTSSTAALAIPIGVANLVLAFVLNVAPRALRRWSRSRHRGVAMVAARPLPGAAPARGTGRVERAVRDRRCSSCEAVGKLRVADAERRRGFARWGSASARLKRRFYDAQIGFAAATSVTAAAPAVATLVVVVGAATLPPGDDLAARRSSPSTPRFSRRSRPSSG